MRYPDDFINKVIQGDCLGVMKQIPDNSVDTIITDPPYGLEFMGKEWDSFRATRQTQSQIVKNLGVGMWQTTRKEKLNYQEWITQWAKEALRVVKPGATLLVFGGTRTWHRLAVGIEDAGWQIKDTLMWLYGSGFPKSTDISKMLDKDECRKQLTEELGRKPTKEELKKELERFRKVISRNPNSRESCNKSNTLWEGYGTALKPAFEPILVCMKPLDGTYVENALKWKVAGLNIDEARIKTKAKKWEHPRGGIWKTKPEEEAKLIDNPQGRFPANLILDEESAKLLDQQSGDVGGGHWAKTKVSGYGKFGGGKSEYFGAGIHDSRGGASRFFYVAKASKKERNMGEVKNNHPTIKPLKLMEYLVKLTLMPNPNQIYLDPFAGSGTTCIAVKGLGRNFIGIEKEEEYIKIANARLRVQPTSFSLS